MIKVMMKDGSEYELNYNHTNEFIDKFLKGKLNKNGELPSKLVNILDGVYINLSAISSIEEEKYITGMDALIP